MFGTRAASGWVVVFSLASGLCSGLGCGGGQTEQTGVLVCEDICCGQGLPRSRYVPARQSAAMPGLKRLEGSYAVPLFWLPTDTELPLPPADAMPRSQTTLRFELEYVGGETGTIMPCQEEPLLPVRVMMQSDDGLLATEFLAIASEPGSRGHLAAPAAAAAGLSGLPIELSGIRSHSKGIKVVTTLPPSAGTAEPDAGAAGGGTTYLQVASEALLALPDLASIGEEQLDGGGCRSRAALGFDVDGVAVGRLCLPESGLAVWPVPCGGIATVEPEHGDAVGANTLLDTGHLTSTDAFEGLVDLKLMGAEDICLLGPGSPLLPLEGLTRAEFTFGLANEEARVTVPVRLRGPNSSLPAQRPGDSELPGARLNYSATFDLQCFEYDSGNALTEVALAALACEWCAEEEGYPELAQIVETGIVGGQACVDGFVRMRDGGLMGALEILFTFRSEANATLTRGYALTFD